MGRGRSAVRPWAWRIGKDGGGGKREGFGELKWGLEVGEALDG